MPVLVPGLTGTLINTITVVIGSLVGLFIGHRLSAHMQKTVLHGLGLVTLAVAMSNALMTRNILVPLFAVAGGAILPLATSITRPSIDRSRSCSAGGRSTCLLYTS
ncbi:MAG: DUF554 family protein, partial [Caldilineales bacterium]|nr:DUF554 family protein [Caldilineales bacterium]